MHFLSSTVVLLAICGLAVAGHLYHHSHHGGEEHHGSSYAVVSKHEEPAVKHELNHGGHEWAHYEHESAGGHDAGSYDAGHGHEEEHGHEDSHDYHAHPKYEFDYAVKDEKTGDSKNHWETRDGDKVKGAYTIKEADGTTRIVEYSADHKNGFNAVVKTVGEPHVEHTASHDYSGYAAEGHGGYESQGHGGYESQGHGGYESQSHGGYEAQGHGGYESHDYSHYGH